MSRHVVAVGFLLVAFAIGSRVLLGVLYTNLGFTYLTRAFRDPSSTSLQARAGIAYGRAIEVDKGNSRAYLGYGRLLLQKGDFQGAVDSFLDAQAHSVYPDGISFWLAGNGYAEMGQIDAAVAQWQHAGAGSYFLQEGKDNLQKGSSGCSDAETSLTRATEIDPQLAEAQYALGQALQCLGKDDEAAEYYGRAAQLYGVDSPWRYLAQGNVSRHSGLWDEAISAYQAAITHEQSDEQAGIEAREAISEILSTEKGDVAGAVSYLEAVIAARPSDVSQYIRVGDVYLAAKQYSQAREWYQRARQLDPNSPEPERYLVTSYVDEGYALRDAGRLDDAEQTFRLAVQLFPDSAPAHDALGWFMELMRHDQERAASEFETAISLSPNDSSAYTMLGYVYLDQGNLGAAVENLQDALARNPRDADAHADLGTAYLHEGALESAVKELEEAVSLMPKEARYDEMLGDALVRAGRATEAADAYRQALALEPNRAHSQQELRKLLNPSERQ